MLLSCGDALIDFILRIDRKHAFPSRIKNDLAESNSSELAILVEQPGNQLINRRVWPFGLKSGRIDCDILLGKTLGRAESRDGPGKNDRGGATHA